MTPKEKKRILHIDDLPENAFTSEVAEFFRTTDLTIRAWIKDGKFPNAYNNGKRYLIPKPDVIAHMQSMYGKR